MSVGGDANAVLLIMAAALAAFSCGSDGASSSGSCTAPAMACGGDVVGIWKVTSTCALSGNSQPIGACAGTSATLESVTVTGTIEFRADGAEVSTGSISENVSYSFPQSCLKQACADTAPVLSTSTMANGQTPSGASCSASGSTCGCSVRIQGAVQDNDTYTVSGGTVTTTSGKDGSVTTQSYCVQGTEVTAWGEGVLLHAEKQ